MEFKSINGLRLRLWFTAGEVVTARSWIYRGEWHYETWIRNDDGREWRSSTGLLGIGMNRGQRLAFAWCAANGAENGDLVAVRNCTTGESRATSTAIACEYDRRAYGRWGMLTTALAILMVWQFGYQAKLPFSIADNWLTWCLALVLVTGFIGFILSCSVDPDPNREVDRRIHLALAGMEHAWQELRAAATCDARVAKSIERIGPRSRGSRGQHGLPAHLAAHRRAADA
jgi:hypothetical protein